MNSEIDIKLRRYSNNLSISGYGCIIFGFWGVIREVMQMTMGDKNIGAMVEKSLTAEDNREMAITITTIVMLVLFAIICTIHTVIGLKAVKYSRGYHIKNFFYVGTILLTLLNFVSLIFYPLNIKNGVSNLSILLIASFWVDLTIVFILIDMTYSAIQIRRLIKQKNITTNNLQK